MKNKKRKDYKAKLKFSAFQLRILLVIKNFIMFIYTLIIMFYSQSSPFILFVNKNKNEKYYLHLLI